jgi:prepilin-type N-terminal cleavage/methylation domain-containing protein
MKLTHKSGFTLLEIIIVIIIVGVLASLALPRFFATVEFSRSTEALQNGSVVRQSIERCYLGRSGTYVGCTIATIDVDNPSNAPGTHFTYTISGQTATAYTIVARRNAVDGGDSNSQIYIEQGPAGVTRSGTGTFVGVR